MINYRVFIFIFLFIAINLFFYQDLIFIIDLNYVSTKEFNDLRQDHNVTTYDVWTETGRSHTDQIDFKKRLVKYYHRSGYFSWFDNSIK